MCVCALRFIEQMECTQYHLAARNRTRIEGIKGSSGFFAAFFVCAVPIFPSSAVHRLVLDPNGVIYTPKPNRHLCALENCIPSLFRCARLRSRLLARARYQFRGYRPLETASPIAHSPATSPCNAANDPHNDDDDDDGAAYIQAFILHRTPLDSIAHVQGPPHTRQTTHRPT